MGLCVIYIVVSKLMLEMIDCDAMCKNYHPQQGASMVSPQESSKSQDLL